uniref:RING-type domain-containing protein n=1 Tax=Timema cristinae TaxID=61476 RepID=A0A7R9D7R2_TIMCR|nr:unnamed protein product [Timema cristinae]
MCKICFTEEMGVLFLPCGHIVACVKCASSLTTCAVCRQPFTATVRAYLMAKLWREQDNFGDNSQLTPPHSPISVVFIDCQGWGWKLVGLRCILALVMNALTRTGQEASFLPLPVGCFSSGNPGRVLPGDSPRATSRGFTQWAAKSLWRPSLCEWMRTREALLLTTHTHTVVSTFRKAGQAFSTRSSLDNLG